MFKLIFTYVIFLSLLLTTLYCDNSTELSNTRSYEKILIYIHDKVPEGDGTLLKNIQNYVKSASRALFKATSSLSNSISGTGVKFGKIYIRIPPNWRSAVSSEPVTWQQCNKATFLVQSSSKDDTKIFTKQLGKCGEPGEFIKFPHKFFLQTNADSMENVEIRKMGKTIVSEFARLRYGVFPEIPEVLTVYDGETFLTSTCKNDININMLNDKKEKVSNSRVCVSNKHCTYSIDPNQKFEHSLMFDQTTDTNEYFCNNDNRPHNKYAINLHNRKCEQKSVAEVILQHSDFKTPLSTSYTDPTFVVVSGKPRKTVLVIDVSGSMSGIIENVKQAAIGFIKDYVAADEYVGLVTFTDTAYVLSTLVPMDSTNKNILIEKINNTRALSSTNIPSGLREAVQVLGGSITNDDKIFGSILLLSDGGNNVEEYNYQTYIEQIIKKGIIANVIAYTSSADVRLSYLTEGTGGKLINAFQDTIELMKAFSTSLDCEDNENRKQIIIQKTTIVIMVSARIDVTLGNLDSFLGTDVTVDLSFAVSFSSYTFTLINPNGKEIRENRRKSMNTEIFLSFELGDNYIIGIYTIRITSVSISRRKRATESIKYTTAVSAKNTGTSRRIVPKGSINKSNIQLLESSTRILATVDLTNCEIDDQTEKVTVKLTIKKDNNNITQYSMSDNGKGEDSISNDKIFTKEIYPKVFQSIGFYSFEALVTITSQSADPIERTVDLGSLRVQQISSNAFLDTVKPGQVTDLILKVNDTSSKTIATTFITVGDDEMEGEISKYEFNISNSNTNIVDIKETPNKLPGTNLSVTLLMPLSTNSFAIQIRGIDKAGNKGLWSMPVYYSWDYEEKLNQIKTSNNSNIANCHFIFQLISVLIWYMFLVNH